MNAVVMTRDREERVLLDAKEKKAKNCEKKKEAAAASASTAPRIFRGHAKKGHWHKENPPKPAKK